MNDEQKWVGKSKTVLGVVLATLTLWLPQFGVDFGEADASFFAEAWNELLATGFAAYAIYGRVTARAKVYF